MKYYSTLPFSATRRKLNQNKHKQCFELFGLDYILDTDNNVWLIEVNTNPCLEESSKLLKTLMPRMLDDAFKLTLDQMFPPLLSRKSREKPFNLEKDLAKREKLRQSFNDSAHPSKRDEKSEVYSVPGYHDCENMWQQIAQFKCVDKPMICVERPQKYVESDHFIHV